MTSGNFYYFAYGSNMPSERLKVRCPSAKALGVAKLPGWKFVWNKESNDGSAKANIQKGESSDCVFGVIYTINNNELLELQNAEGAYSQKQLQSYPAEGEIQLAGMVYVYIYEAQAEKGEGD